MIFTKLVVLVHGYFRTDADMLTMKNHLERIGYKCHVVKLPTTFGSLEECTQVLEKEIAHLPTHDTSLSLVGHSMGGLVIRRYLSQNKVANLGRCVLIATPNAGTKLANIMLKMLAILPINPLKSLHSLKINCNEIPPPLNEPYPEIGVITGNNSNLLLGKWLSYENDGRVEVESAKFSGMKDFIVLNFGHNDIHHQEQTACLVHRFLEKGTFSEFK